MPKPLRSKRNSINTIAQGLTRPVLEELHSRVSRLEQRAVYGVPVREATPVETPYREVAGLSPKPADFAESLIDRISKLSGDVVVLTGAATHMADKVYGPSAPPSNTTGPTTPVCDNVMENLVRLERNMDELRDALSRLNIR